MGYLQDDKYSKWRRQWLQWHARSLLASALLIHGAERDAYLDEMLTEYFAYDDFSAHEISFIFRRVCRGEG